MSEIASRLFTQSFIQTQIKENIKAPRHWPLCGEFTGHRWIPRTNGQLCGKCFHLMTSSWSLWLVRLLGVIILPAIIWRNDNAIIRSNDNSINTRCVRKMHGVLYTIRACCGIPTIVLNETLSQSPCTVMTTGGLPAARAVHMVQRSLVSQWACFLHSFLVSIWIQMFGLVGTPLPASGGRTPPFAPTPPTHRTKDLQFPLKKKRW